MLGSLQFFCCSFHFFFGDAIFSNASIFSSYSFRICLNFLSASSSVSSSSLCLCNNSWLFCYNRLVCSLILSCCFWRNSFVLYAPSSLLNFKCLPTALYGTSYSFAATFISKAGSGRLKRIRENSPNNAVLFTRVALVDQNFWCISRMSLLDPGFIRSSNGERIFLRWSCH